MTTFFDWLRNNTQGITEAARQVLYMLLGFEVLRNTRGEPWSDAQLGLVMAALSSLLTLIAAKTTVSAHKVEARKNEAFDKGVVEGVRQMSSGTGDGR
jgi:hypothetical protein